MSEQDRTRYYKAWRAMQFHLERIAGDLTDHPKPIDLLGGITTGKINRIALESILIEKGIVTRDEIDKSMAEQMEKEAKRIHG